MIGAFNPSTPAPVNDLCEILEERYGSTILTSQIPVDKSHAMIDDPTYADAMSRSRKLLDGQLLL